jgi:phytoene desaturase
MKTVTLIGSFFSLSAACYMAKNGYKVTLFEKNDTIEGGRGSLPKRGFTFDMGPTFYWMPDLIERFFNDFGKTSADYYDLIRLDPGYKIYFSEKEALSVSADLTEIYAMFDSLSPKQSVFTLFFTGRRV